MSDRKGELRNVVRENLSDIMGDLNAALSGKGLTQLEPVIKRVGRGGQLPHWYAELAEKNTLV